MRIGVLISGMAFLALGPLGMPPARASVACGVLDDSLKYEIDEFTAYRAQNQLMLQNLLGMETGCKDKGAALSQKVAEVAQGLSCQAAIDASKMDEQLTGLGEHCESHFAEIHALQDQLRAQFATVETDLNAGMESMKRSQRIQARCADEVKSARSMVDTFLDLQRGILDVEGRSLDGQTNYGKFKQTAADLRNLTASQGENCGAGAGAVLEVLKSAGAGTPRAGAVPAGKSADPSSTITGNTDEKSLTAGLASPAPRKPAWAPGTLAAAPAVAQVGASSIPGAVAAAGPFSSELPPATGSQPKIAEAAVRGPASANGEPSAGGILWQESADRTGFHLTLGGGAAAPGWLVSGQNPGALSSGLSGVLPSPLVGGGGAGALAGGDASDESIFLRVKRCYQRTALFSAGLGGISAGSHSP